ncbi:MAG TPA: hypothetical protein VMX94_11310 [Armatimonadota bacterium]|nr:hypothetical protein [Armatimonadota bacterium]
MEVSAFRRSLLVFLKAMGITLSILFVAALLFPIFFRHGQESQSSRCARNLKLLACAMRMYADDWDDRLPVLRSNAQQVPQGQAWPDVLKPYLARATKRHPRPFEEIIHCRSAFQDGLSYSFNRRLSGRDIKRDIADRKNTVLIFDTVSDSSKNNNLNGDRAFYPSHGGLPRPGDWVVPSMEFEKRFSKWPVWARPSHDESNNAVFVDGHVKRCGPDYQPRFSPK